MLNKNEFTIQDSISIKSYLGEVNRIPLITLKQEIELGERINDGDKSAVDELIRTNLRIVVRLAKPYVNSKLRLEDLINEGNIGLIEAANDFDVTLGFKFISYARAIILSHIQSYCNEEGLPIRIPHGKIKAIRKVNKFITRFSFLNSRDPSESEVINGLSSTIRLSVLQEVFNIKNGNFTSIDAPLTHKGGEVSNYQLPNPQQPTSHLVEQLPAVEGLKRILTTLNDKERGVIESLYGLFGKEELTIGQIAFNSGFTPSRIQQIAANALSKLQGLSKTQKFQDVLN